MRTPWKIIGRLFSRGRTSQTAESRDETSDKVFTSTAGVDAVAEPFQLELEAPAENTKDEPSDRASPTAEAAKATAERIAVVSEHASQKDQAARRKGRGNTPLTASVTGRASPASTHPATPRQATKAKRPAAKPSNLRRTPTSRKEGPPQARQQALFDADAINLDAEIRALSRQLSAKLRQQNVQLRKMLERFGAI